MSVIASKSSRRAFFLTGGAALGAGVAATASAAVLQPAAAPASAAEDREAIRRTHLALLNFVERQQPAAAAQLFVEPQQCTQSTALHSAYRHTSQQQLDVLNVSADRLRASATFHVEVQLSTPLQGDSTLEQMARLQGNFAEQRWQAGRFEAQYVRNDGQWQVASLRFLPA